MRDDTSHGENLPLNDHLQEDISAPSDQGEAARDDFTPGQTNAGQQVGGLASTTGYGDGQDPDSGTDTNNPI